MSGPYLIWVNPNTPAPSARKASLFIIVSNDVLKPTAGASAIAGWMEHEFDRLTCGRTISRGASVIFRDIPQQDQLAQACMILLSKGYCCSEPVRLEPKFPGDDPAVTVWLERH